MSREINPCYQEQIDIQKYAEQQREKIRRFLELKGTKTEFLSPGTAMTILEEAQNDYRKANLRAIIDPAIVQMLDYEPVRTVVRVRKVSLERKEWLIGYWFSNYELDLTDQEQFQTWDHEVGLLFYRFYPDSWGGDYHPCSYDYPSCVLQIVRRTVNA